MRNQFSGPKPAKLTMGTSIILLPAIRNSRGPRWRILGGGERELSAMFELGVIFCIRTGEIAIKNHRTTRSQDFIIHSSLAHPVLFRQIF